MVGVTSSRNLLSKSDNLDEVIAGFLSRWERTQYLFSEGVVRMVKRWKVWLGELWSVDMFAAEAWPGELCCVEVCDRMIAGDDFVWVVKQDVVGVLDVVRVFWVSRSGILQTIHRILTKTFSGFCITIEGDLVVNNSHNHGMRKLKSRNCVFVEKEEVAVFAIPLEQ
ncbi:hypothetical protein YC2023_027797 [Brassica napus]